MANQNGDEFDPFGVRAMGPISEIKRLEVYDGEEDETPPVPFDTETQTFGIDYGEIESRLLAQQWVVHDEQMFFLDHTHKINGELEKYLEKLREDLLQNFSIPKEYLIPIKAEASMKRWISPTGRRDKFRNEVMGHLPPKEETIEGLKKKVLETIAVRNGGSMEERDEAGWRKRLRGLREMTDSRYVRRDRVEDTKDEVDDGYKAPPGVATALGSVRSARS